MKKIGIRIFKAQASSIVRNVAEAKVSYVITNHGRAMGLLSPIHEPGDEPRPAGDLAWRNLFDQARRLNAESSSRKSAVRALHDMRR
jgi:antitoxin (DNA-binding transcriptional repressor) of toxin-antitoxin stability system